MAIRLEQQVRGDVGGVANGTLRQKHQLYIAAELLPPSVYSSLQQSPRWVVGPENAGRHPVRQTPSLIRSILPFRVAWHHPRRGGGYVDRILCSVLQLLQYPDGCIDVFSRRTQPPSSSLDADGASNCVAILGTLIYFSGTRSAPHSSKGGRRRGQTHAADVQHAAGPPDEVLNRSQAKR